MPIGFPKGLNNKRYSEKQEKASKKNKEARKYLFLQIYIANF